MSYRKDSDIWLPYGEILKVNQSIPPSNILSGEEFTWCIQQNVGRIGVNFVGGWGRTPLILGKLVLIQI